MTKKKNTKDGFQKRTVHNLIILDESGSMESIKNATIQGFNEVVQTIKGVEKQYPEQKHYVTLVTFNGFGIKTKLFAEKVAGLKEINDQSYRPDAMTPLFDAIGLSATKLLKKLGKKKNCNVLVTILTDGLENASKEYSGPAVKQLIEDLKQKDWTFTYIGANHDVERVAFSLAIPNYMKFEANPDDVKRAFDQDRVARLSFAAKMRRGADLQADYFEDTD
jgi:mevalonate kinase